MIIRQRPAILNGLDQQTITFVVTEQCNLRCRYCYMCKKNPRRMPQDIAQRCIDFILEKNHEHFSDRASVVWEFIGGEPLLELDLIEQIISYTQRRAFELGHPWFSNMTYSFSSNGVLYTDLKFQQLLRRQSNISCNLTIDGPPYVHDRMRVFPDGTGSHAAVVRNVPLWLEQFPWGSSKVTVTHDTLPFVKETVLYLHELGIKTIHSNVVFEDVWQPGDAELFERQLRELGDELLIRNWIPPTYECSFFNRTIGKPIDFRETVNWCGAGKYMTAFGPDGRIYPCVRFMDFTLAKRDGYAVGNLDRGIDRDRLAPFMNLTRTGQSTEECITCPVASGCAWCQGFNYDDTGRIDQRVTYICPMHKARVRANARFWAKIDALEAQQCRL